MRIVIIGLLVLLLLFLVLKPLIKDREQPSKFLVICVLLPTIVLGVFEFKWQTSESRASEVVQLVSGNKESKAQCQRFSEAFFDAATFTKGMVYYADTKVAHIKYETCQDLFNWLSSDKKNPSVKEIQAVGVLVHESIHVQGEFNEAVTECKSMKRLAEVAVFLGATEKEGLLLAERYKKEVHVRTPSEYQNGVC